MSAAMATDPIQDIPTASAPATSVDPDRRIDIAVSFILPLGLRPIPEFRRRAFGPDTGGLVVLEAARGAFSGTTIPSGNRERGRKILQSFANAKSISQSICQGHGPVMFGAAVMQECRTSLGCGRINAGSATIIFGDETEFFRARRGRAIVCPEAEMNSPPIAVY
jgi:hypothetical protein